MVEPSRSFYDADEDIEVTFDLLVTNIIFGT
jgi:hypothetical protein